MKKPVTIMLILFILFSFSYPASATEKAAVFVRDGGVGDGSSKDSPVGTLEEAYRILCNSTDIASDPDSSALIVICGTLTVNDHFNYYGEISHKGEVIYTSVYGGEDFRQAVNARLLISAGNKSDLSVYDEHRFLLGGPTRFDGLTIDRGSGSAVSLTIYAPDRFYVSENVEIVNSNWRADYVESVPALSDDEINSIILSAHRGFQPMGPENSIIAFEAAGSLGFDYIETDVIMTMDGELVCIHDNTLDRTTNGTGNVMSMTYPSILRYKIDTAAYGFDLSTADKDKLYVPTFREYLDICRKHGSKPFIEIKDSRKEVIHKIIDVALEYFSADEIVMSCSNLAALEVSHSYNKDVFVHLIWGDQTDAGYQNSIKILSAMTDSSGTVNAGIAFNIKDLTSSANYDRARAWIEKAHASSLLTCLRGADDMTEVRLMFDLGIDYYPTNTTTPEKLESLKISIDGGYTYSPASGGKLFIRGGSRCKRTDTDISITLLGGMYDFVAPSNAEAESLGEYRVTVGGNAFVSRLVAGETAKSAGGNRPCSIIRILDSAVINELFVAGDSAVTRSVILDLKGGRVLAISESRGKGGKAVDLTMILRDASLIPSTVSIADKSVILGKRVLQIYGEVPSDTSAWDVVILLENEATGSVTIAPDVPEATSAPTVTSPNTSEETIVTLPQDHIFPLPNVIVALIVLAAAIAALIFAKRSKKQNNNRDF